jgi:hypothetical protein
MDRFERNITLGSLRCHTDPVTAPEVEGSTGDHKVTRGKTGGDLHKITGGDPRLNAVQVAPVSLHDEDLGRIL